MNRTGTGTGAGAEVEIEVADSADVDAVVDRWVALLADQRPLGTHLLPEANRSTARDFIAQSVLSETVLVARAAGGVVGFVDFHTERGVYEQDVERGVVDNVYVDPAYRDRGVGSRLLDAAEAALREAGVDVLAISVLADNDAARRLYERRGYRPHRVELERPADSPEPAESDRDSSPDAE